MLHTIQRRVSIPIWLLAVIAAGLCVIAYGVGARRTPAPMFHSANGRHWMFYKGITYDLSNPNGPPEVILDTEHPTPPPVVAAPSQKPPPIPFDASN